MIKFQLHWLQKKHMKFKACKPVGSLQYLALVTMLQSSLSFQQQMNKIRKKLWQISKRWQKNSPGWIYSKAFLWTVWIYWLWSTIDLPEYFSSMNSFKISSATKYCGKSIVDCNWCIQSILIWVSWSFQILVISSQYPDFMLSSQT
jgi:hypothetical protein